MNDELAATLTEEVTDRLDAYMAERSAVKTAQDQAPVIAAFLGEELQLEDVSAADLSTVYKVMGWKIAGVERRCATAPTASSTSPVRAVASA